MADNKIIVLKSPDPFENRHRGFLFFLMAFIIPFAIWYLGHLLFDPESFMGLAFMFIGAGVALVIIVLAILNQKSALKHMTEIRNMKFKLTTDANLENIYNKIEPALINVHGGKVKFFRKSECVTVTFDGIYYEIILNNDASFSIHWQKSFFDKALHFLAFIADREDEGEPIWKYDKIRTETPIIAFWLQQTFGVTSTSDNELSASSGQTIQEIYERTKRSANNSGVTERRQETLTNTSVSSRNKKIIAAALVAIAGLMIMLASYDKITPITVDRFIEHYNKEIKRTAGAVVENKYHGQSKLVENCTLNDVKIGQGCKYQTLFGKDMYTSIYFTAYDLNVGGNRNEPINIGFSFYDEAPVDAVFAIIEATIAAVGDDEDKVAQALGILSGNHYNIPYNYNKKITFNDKEYSITSFDRGIVFSVTIASKK